MKKILAGFDPDRHQFLTVAGAGDAFTVFDTEQSTMRGALDQLTATVEKLMFNPVKINAHVRALVAITEYSIVLSNQQ